MYELLSRFSKKWKENRIGKKNLDAKNADDKDVSVPFLRVLEMYLSFMQVKIMSVKYLVHISCLYGLDYRTIFVIYPYTFLTVKNIYLSIYIAYIPTYIYITYIPTRMYITYIPTDWNIQSSFLFYLFFSLFLFLFLCGNKLYNYVSNPL